MGDRCGSGNITVRAVHNPLRRVRRSRACLPMTSAEPLLAVGWTWRRDGKAA